jgi:hypothetical protein
VAFSVESVNVEYTGSSQGVTAVLSDTCIERMIKSDLPGRLTLWNRKHSHRFEAEVWVKFIGPNQGCLHVSGSDTSAKRHGGRPGGASTFAMRMS